MAPSSEKTKIETVMVVPYRLDVVGARPSPSPVGGAVSPSAAPVGTGTVPLQSPRLAVQELERCMDQLGLQGVQIGSHVQVSPDVHWNLDAPELFPFFEAAADLGAGAEPELLADRDGAAQQQAVDMGVDEPDRIRCEQPTHQERGAQPLGVIARDVVGRRSVKDPHRHATASPAARWCRPSARHRMASAWPYAVGWIGMSR